MPFERFSRFLKRAQKHEDSKVGKQSNIFDNRFFKTSENFTVQRVKVIKKANQVKGAIGIAFPNPNCEFILPFFKLIYYPRLEHTSQFINAHAGLLPLGPSRRYPGSVGSIRVDVNKDTFEIGYAQAHFKTKNKTGAISRAIATKYGGWRIRLFEEVFSLAKEKRAKVKFNSDKKDENDQPIKSTSLPQKVQDFILAAKRQGFKVIEEPKNTYVAEVI